MNREILFKAKRLDNGEWVEGYYLNIAKINHFICTGKIKFDGALKGIIVPEMYAIDHDTLCQYTGLTDKNGKKIFEGDIVRDGENYGEVKFGLYESDWQIDKYNQGFFVTFPKEYLFRRELGFWRNKIVVVGNIFDNADLLEVE